MISAYAIPIPSSAGKSPFPYSQFTEPRDWSPYTERMDSDVVTLGKRIAAAREDRHWSKSDLARRANVAASYITRIERGDFDRPSVDRVKAIADALHLNVSDLTEPPRVPSSVGAMGELELLFGEDERPLIFETIAGLKRHSPRQRRKILDILRTLVLDLPEPSQ